MNGFREYNETDFNYYQSEKSKNRNSFLNTLKEVFLPKGYPSSVSKDYLSYQIWDTLQAFFSSICRSLAIQSVLKGVGVGDDTANLLSASLSWLIKDGSGMIGSILFAWGFGEVLDGDCKKWRLFADILNDIATLIDFLSSLVPSLFTLMLCFSSIAKSMVGMAGSATRAALIQHQAINNNLADVVAKDGSQETLVNLVALLTSIFILPIIHGNDFLVVVMLIVLIFLHIYCNYRAVRSLQMSSFNEARFEIIWHYFMKTSQIKSVWETNNQENVFPFIASKSVPLQFGQQVKETYLTSKISQVYEKQKYVIFFSDSGMKVALSREYDQTTLLKAYFHAMIYHNRHKSYVSPYLTNITTSQMSLLSHSKSPDVIDTHSKLLSIVDMLFDKFYESLANSDWNTNQILMVVGKWRSSWS